MTSKWDELRKECPKFGEPNATCVVALLVLAILLPALCRVFIYWRLLALSLLWRWALSKAQRANDKDVRFRLRRIVLLLALHEHLAEYGRLCHCVRITLSPEPRIMGALCRGRPEQEKLFHTAYVLYCTEHCTVHVTICTRAQSFWCFAGILVLLTCSYVLYKLIFIPNTLTRICACYMVKTAHRVQLVRVSENRWLITYRMHDAHDSKLQWLSTSRWEGLTATVAKGCFHGNIFGWRKHTRNQLIPDIYSALDDYSICAAEL